MPAVCSLCTLSARTCPALEEREDVCFERKDRRAKKANAGRVMTRGCTVTVSRTGVGVRALAGWRRLALGWRGWLLEKVGHRVSRSFLRRFSQSPKMGVICHRLSRPRGRNRPGRTPSRQTTAHRVGPTRKDADGVRVRTAGAMMWPFWSPES